MQPDVEQLRSAQQTGPAGAVAHLHFPHLVVQRVLVQQALHWKGLPLLQQVLVAERSAEAEEEQPAEPGVARKVEPRSEYLLDEAHEVYLGYPRRRHCRQTVCRKNYHS